MLSAKQSQNIEYNKRAKMILIFSLSGISFQAQIGCGYF